MYGVMGTGEISVPESGIRKRRKRLLESLYVEQRKLEAMIVDLFNKGQHDLGKEQMILKQSRKLDQLVIDEMMLEEILNRTE